MTCLNLASQIDFFEERVPRREALPAEKTIRRAIILANC